MVELVSDMPASQFGGANLVCARIRAGSRFKRFLCFVSIHVRCLPVTVVVRVPPVEDHCDRGQTTHDSWSSAASGSVYQTKFRASDYYVSEEHIASIFRDYIILVLLRMIGSACSLCLQTSCLDYSPTLKAEAILFPNVRLSQSYTASQTRRP
jgi:hypothetical protein